MAERKPIPKKIRFEVFKRDRFTCQYCGRTAPDVILQIDHIKPVSKGGTNDIINLVTSCRDCNLGKGARELTDDAIIKAQQKQLQDLAEKQEQLEMLVEWRTSLQDLDRQQLEAINRTINEYTDESLTKHGEMAFRNLLKQFTVQEVLEAIDISFNKYYSGTHPSIELAISKIGGICYNRRNRPDLDEKQRTYKRWWNGVKEACEAYEHWSLHIHDMWDLYLSCVHDESSYEAFVDSIRRNGMNLSKIAREFK